MAVPITIDKLLTENIVQWIRIDFKEKWNLETTLKTCFTLINSNNGYKKLLERK